MTAELPKPESVWADRDSKRLIRAVLVTPDDIVCHDCEVTARVFQVGMNSWRGTLEDFHNTFYPVEQSLYPKTAR